MFYKDIEYPHSFIIGKDKLNLEELKDYNLTVLYDYSVYSSQTQDITTLDKGNIKYILIGYALDIRDGNMSNVDILEMLHKSSTVIEDLEYISGRYIYIKAVSKEMYIYSDASQLQPLVFNRESETLSSHDNLLAEVLKDNNYKVTRRPLEVHNELDFTRFEEIQKFNPSMRLRTEDFSYRRIYPRVSIKTASIETIYPTISKYFDQMIKWLKSNQQTKFLTVTGGIDSRVSAALSKNIEGIEYLTYSVPAKSIKADLARKIYRVDTKITNEMKENLRWNHSILDLSKISLSPEELKFYETFYNSKHGYKLDKYYREEKKYKKALHIKSTVFGMGKGDFPTSLDVKSSDLDFYRRCIHGISNDFETHYNLDTEVEKYFERNLVEKGVTKGRHYFDLFHLESRMGNWHSSLTLETDPETEEFIFTNSRKIIDLIQLPTLAERRNFTLYKEIIKNYWPVLLFFGINEEANLFEQTQDMLQTDFKNITIHRNRNLSVRTKTDQVELIPKFTQISMKYNYNFIVENLSDESKIVTILSEYSKEEARGLIKVVIRNNGKFYDFDILDLNKGVEFEIKGNSLSVNLLYNKEYSSDSWRKAGKLILKNR